MYHRIFLYIILIVFSVKLAASEHKFEQHITIAAPSLSNALLNTSTKQPISVYLPKSYFTTNTAFPVIYYLHGYGGKPTQAKILVGDISNNLISKGKAKEMIVVGVNGHNQFAGSFYQNSPVTGNWEDFVTKDVISYVDKHYRTLASAQHRGLAGLSMGGYAALNIGLKNADIYQHVFSLSPGLFDNNGLDKAIKQWQEGGWHTFLDGYAAAFAPKVDNHGTERWYKWHATDKTIRNMYESGFGNVKQKIAQYKQSPNKLASLHIEYGTQDEFTWIPEGSRFFIRELQQQGIAVTSVAHQSGHNPTQAQRENIVKYFSKKL